MLTAVCAVIVVLCAGLMPDPYAAVACSAVAVALFLSAIFLGLRNNVVKCAAFSIAFVVAISCFLITIITRHNWTNELSDSSDHYISGTIVSRKLTDSGARYVLDDVTADSDEIKGKVSIVATDDDSATVAFLKCGDRVGITASVTFKKLTTKNRYAIRDNVRYFIKANASDLEFYKSTSGFFFKLRNEMSDALDKNLGDYGQIALGMLTGDKGGVDDDVIDYYSVSGIGHILSVSGLHVGFVVVLMSFILDKLRANRTVKLVVIACALIFYCFLASFALSVVRASIMCVLGLLAGTLGKQRDPLSGLCFAVTAILAVKPLSLFDVGFLMSVSAVLGILLFSKSFNRVFSRFLPKSISSALSVSLAAQIGITPVSLVFFNTFPTYSVLINLIVIPIVTIAFIALAVTVTITLIIPGAGILLSIAGIPLVLVDDIARLAYKLPLAEIRIYAAAWFLAVFVLYFVCSSFFMMKRFKPLVICACVIISCACVTITSIPVDKSFDVAAVSEYKSVTTVIRADNKTFVVGDVGNKSTVLGTLADLKARSIDAVYLNKLDEIAARNILAINYKYEIKAVYFPLDDTSDGMSVLAKGGFDKFYPLTDAGYDKIEPIFFDDSVGYVYDSGTAKMLMLGYGVKPQSVPTDVINECAIVRAYVFNESFAERIYIINYNNKYINSTPLYCEVLSEETMCFSTETGEIFIL